MDENDIGQQWRGFRRPFQGSPQQGTLFDKRSVERAPITTPGSQRIDRRRAMVAAMPETWVGSTDPLHQEIQPKVERRQARYIDTYEGDARENVLRGVVSRSAGAQHRAELGRTLAEKTTVEPHHLEGLKRVDVGQVPQGKDGSLYPSFSSPSVAAHYTDRPASGPRIQAPGRMEPTTFVHEIGHHVSAQEGYKHVEVDPDLQINLGEEGRADAFMLNHVPTASSGRTSTYASRARQTDAEGKFYSESSPYRASREGAGQPLADDIERPGTFPPPRPDETLPRQYEIFTTESTRINAPYMGVDVGVNVYRPNPVLDRSNRPIGFEVQPGESTGLYEVEGGGHLDPRDTGYYWKRRGEGDERLMPHHLEMDGVTLETIDQEERR